MMKRKVVNLEYYRKFRPVKRKMKAVKKIFRDILNDLKKIYIG